MNEPGHIVLFRKVMEDWGITPDEYAVLLASGDDNIRSVLRIATDLDALFRDETIVSEWLNIKKLFAFHPMSRETARSIMLSGLDDEIEVLKQHVAWLSGR